MLDRLLGRASLKERIAELEDEKRRLEERAESARESRAEAVSARQEAEERVNRLQDRVTELEDRVERLQGDEPAPEFRFVETVRRDRRDEVVSRLRSVETEPEGALTAFVPDGDDVPDAVRDAFGDRVSLVSRAAPCLVCTDDAGLVSAALSIPVEPDPFVEWGDGFRVAEGWVRPTGRTCFALVRSDLFAGGVYEDGERVAFEGFESDVMGEHSKGGFSQARFERRRESQIDEHLNDCREALDDLATDVDRVILVGGKTVLTELRDRADVTATVDATGEPEEALDAAVDDFWTLRVRAI